MLKGTKMTRESLERHRMDWEELGEMDPLWAILSVPGKQFRRWDLNAFFREGEEEVRSALDVARELGYPRRHERALDFGCGIGRLTRFLGSHFRQSYGADISETMVRSAQEINAAFKNCIFQHITQGHLGQFDDGFFDFVITRHVLQHLPSRTFIRSYIAEMVRVLAPGGLLVFQLPVYIPWRNRVQARRRLYAILRSLGFQHRFLYERLSLNPVRMSFLAEDDVHLLLRTVHARLLRVVPEPISRDGISANCYYVNK